MRKRTRKRITAFMTHEKTKEIILTPSSFLFKNIHLYYFVFVIFHRRSLCAGSCSLFGHSCLGGHGKRASADVTLDGIPDWPIHASGVVGVDPVLKRKTNPPLEALVFIVLPYFCLFILGLFLEIENDE